MCLMAGLQEAESWVSRRHAAQRSSALPLELITKAPPCASMQATGFKSLLRTPLNGASQARTPETCHAFKEEK